MTAGPLHTTQRIARYATICDRCELLIKPGQAYAVRKRQVIHASCAPGGDDQ